MHTGPAAKKYALLRLQKQSI